MYRIDSSDTTDKLPVPTPPGSNPNSYFRKPDAIRGIKGTILPAEWMNAVQEELANAIEGAGLTLDKSDRKQLLKAIESKVAFSGHPKSPQVIAPRVKTKLIFDGVFFNHGEGYNAALSRFTPSAAGLYLVTGKVFLFANQPTVSGIAGIYLLRNGVHILGNVSAILSQDYPNAIDAQITAILPLDGQSDYVECFVETEISGTATVGIRTLPSFFQAIKIK